MSTPTAPGQCQTPGCESQRTVTSSGRRGWCSRCQKRRETERNRAKGPCEVEGCGKPRHQARRYCSMHTRRLSVYGDVHAELPPRPRGSMYGEPAPCAVPGCERDRYTFTDNSRGRQSGRPYCGGHLARRKKYGDFFEDIPLGDKRVYAYGRSLPELRELIRSGRI